MMEPDHLISNQFENDEFNENQYFEKFIDTNKIEFLNISDFKKLHINDLIKNQVQIKNEKSSKGEIYENNDQILNIEIIHDKFSDIKQSQKSDNQFD